MSGFQFFVTTFAIKFQPDSSIATLLGEDPFACCQRRVMPDVLPVTTRQNRAPVALVVLLKVSDLLFHGGLFVYARNRSSSCGAKRVATSE